MRVVLKPGTERNGTERTERTERSFFVAETKVGPISVLHRRYRNVHVAAKVSKYSTEGMHCRTTRRLHT